MDRIEHISDDLCALVLRMLAASGAKAYAGITGGGFPFQGRTCLSFATLTYRRKCLLERTLELQYRSIGDHLTERRRAFSVAPGKAREWEAGL
jgi:hypothetical protein